MVEGPWRCLSPLGKALVRPPAVPAPSIKAVFPTSVRTGNLFSRKY